MDYIRAYEYEGNVNPKMNKIPIERKHIRGFSLPRMFTFLHLFLFTTK